MKQLYTDIDTLHSLVTSTPFRREVAIQRTNKLKEDMSRVGISLAFSSEKVAEAMKNLGNALREMEKQNALRSFNSFAKKVKAHKDEARRGLIVD